MMPVFVLSACILQKVPCSFYKVRSERFATVASARKPTRTMNDIDKKLQIAEPGYKARKRMKIKNNVKK